MKTVSIVLHFDDEDRLKTIEMPWNDFGEKFGDLNDTLEAVARCLLVSVQAQKAKNRGNIPLPLPGKDSKN